MEEENKSFIGEFLYVWNFEKRNDFIKKIIDSNHLWVLLEESRYDKSEGIQNLIINRLFQLIEFKEAKMSLIRLLRSKRCREWLNKQVLRNLINIAGSQKSADFIEPLYNLFLEGETNDVRSWAVHALKNLNWEPNSKQEEAEVFVLMEKWKELETLGEEGVKAAIKLLSNQWNEDKEKIGTFDEDLIYIDFLYDGIKYLIFSGNKEAHKVSYELLKQIEKIEPYLSQISEFLDMISETQNSSAQEFMQRFFENMNNR